MLDEIRKNLLTGLGAVLLTKDKIEEITRRLVDETRLSRRDADRLADELYRAGRDQWTSLESLIREAARRALSGMDIASRQEFEKLQSEVRHLRKRVDLLEDMRDASGSH